MVEKLARFRALEQNFQSLQHIRSMDKNKDGQIVLSELDSNKDHELDKEVLDPGKVPSEEQREQIKQKFEAAQKEQQQGLSKDPVVFQVKPLTESLYQIWAEQEALVAPVRSMFKALRESAQGRLALDAINTNGNGRIDKEELQALEDDPELRAKVTSLVAESGQDPTLLEDIPVYLESIKYVDLEHYIDKDAPELNVDYGFNSFDSGNERIWKEDIQPLVTEDSAHKDRLDELALLDLKQPLGIEDTARYVELKREIKTYAKNLELARGTILANSQTHPGVQALLSKLELHGMTNLETLSYIEQLTQKEAGKKMLVALNERLDGFLVSSASELSSKERKQLVCDILHETAWPEDINQASKGTCGATTLQTKLAILDPTKYAQICLTLAEGRPFNLTPSESPGVQLFPNETWRLDVPDQDTRLLSSKIIQNAFMEFSHQYAAKEGPENSTQIEGKRVFYDSRVNVDTAQGFKVSFDKIRKQFPDLASLSDDTLFELGKGTPEPSTAMLEGLLIGKVMTVQNDKKDPHDMVQLIDAQLARGVPVSLTVNTHGQETHAVLVTAKDDSVNPAVYTLTTWRAQFHCTAEEMERFIISLRK